jgi:hypothetical protein
MKDLIIWAIIIVFVAAQIPTINSMFVVLNIALAEITENTFLIGNLHSNFVAFGYNPFYQHFVVYLVINLLFKVI